MKPARDIFPDDEERAEVKSWLDLFNGTIIKVVDGDGKILFDT